MDLSLHLKLFTTTGLFQAVAIVVGANHANVLNAGHCKPGEPFSVLCDVKIFDLSEVEMIYSIRVSRFQNTKNSTEVMFELERGENALTIKEGRNDRSWLYNYSLTPSAQSVNITVLNATIEDCGIYSCRITLRLNGRKQTLEIRETLYCTNDMSDSQGNHKTSGIVVGVLAVLVIVGIAIGLFRKRFHLSQRIVKCSYATPTRDSQLVTQDQGTIGQTLQGGSQSNDLLSDSCVNIDRGQGEHDFSETFICDPQEAGLYSTDKNNSQLMTTEEDTMGKMTQDSCNFIDPPSGSSLNFDARHENNGVDPRRPLKPPRQTKRVQLNCYTSPNISTNYSTDKDDCQLVTNAQYVTGHTPPEFGPSETSLRLDTSRENNESDVHTDLPTNVTSKETLHQLLVVPRRPLGPSRRRKSAQVKCKSSPNISVMQNIKEKSLF